MVCVADEGRSLPKLVLEWPFSIGKDANITNLDFGLGFGGFCLRKDFKLERSSKPRDFLHGVKSP